MFEFINKINQSSLLLICVCIFLIIILFVQKIRFSKLIKEARIDAVKRSKAVIGGQTVEQLAPYLPDFPCSPIDAHFIGKPIDFIAFPGLTETNKVNEVLFIEVKTGNSKLSDREKEIKNAINNDRVRYIEWKFNS